MSEFPSGLVPRSLYQDVESTLTYQSMRRFSDCFLEANATSLSDYGRLWSPDPLANWSRRWEYPFVGSRLVDIVEPGNRWLDAGAGITFLPFWVQQSVPELQISCLDANPEFPAVFRQLTARNSAEVAYLTGDLAETRLPNDLFDVISCVSVMEHLPEPVAALAEMHRLLAPGGHLLLTFDIGLDAFADLTPPALDRCLSFLVEHFDDAENRLVKLSESAYRAYEWVDTYWISEHWPDRLPWRYPRLSVLKTALKKGRFSLKPMKSLTFSCHALQKK